MRIDWTRLILFWVVMYIAQMVLVNLLTLIGVPVNTYAFLVLLDLGLGYVFTWFCYPSFARRGCFKDPDFHKNALIFFLLLFGFDILIR